MFITTQSAKFSEDVKIMIAGKHVIKHTVGMTGNYLGEVNNTDCAVRAFANATARSYDSSHKLFKAAGRKDCTGTNLNVLDRVYKEHGFTVESFGTSRVALAYHVQEQASRRTVTLKTLLSLDKYKKGRYIVLVKGHAVAYIDGIIIDSAASSPKWMLNKHVAAIYTYGC